MRKTPTDGLRVLATIVLVAGLPNRLGIAHQILDILSSQTDPASRYEIRSVDSDTSVPVPEEDWEFQVIRLEAEVTLDVHSEWHLPKTPPPDED